MFIKNIYKLSQHVPARTQQAGCLVSPFILITWVQSKAVFLPIWCVCVQLLSHGWLFATPWTVSQPDSSVHGTFQARILEWIAISYSRGSSQLWDRTCIFCFAYTGRQILNHCTIWEASFQFGENPLNLFPHTFQRPLQIKWKSCNSLE